MKVIVTVGAGNVSSVCVEELVNAGHQVTAIDNLTEGNRRALAWKSRLDSVLESVWRWHKAHPHGYQDA